MKRFTVFFLMFASLLFGSKTARAVVVEDVPFDMPEIVEPTFPDRVCDITDYGAVADGATLNTKAIAAAIEDCASAGGGAVRIPSGDWHTGPIHLKNNINLHADEGAHVLFSTNPEHYLPVVLTRWEGVDCYNFSPLIYCNGCENIAITGKGIFDGQGEAWWHWKMLQNKARDKLYEAGYKGVPVEKRVFGKVSHALRPQLILLINSRNILLEDYTAANSPFWTNHIVYSENVVVRNVRAESPYKSPNTDGLNIDSSRNVYITGFYASVGDDAFCVKSGRNEDGRRVGRPVENVVMENCEVARAHGGFVVGSEMSGGVRNIMVRNCVYRDTDTGIRFKSRRGRGAYVKNVYIRDIEMESLRDTPVHINMYYTPSADVGDSKEPSVFEDFYFSGIKCHGAKHAAIVDGLPEMPIKNLNFTDFDITAQNGMRITNVEGAALENVRITVEKSPAVKFENASGITFQGGSISGGGANLIQIFGEKSKDIQMSVPGLNRGDDIIELDEGAPPDAVILK